MNVLNNRTDMRELWIYKYVVNDNNTGAKLMSQETTCLSKEEAMKMLESKYAEDASMFEIIEETLRKEGINYLKLTGKTNIKDIRYYFNLYFDTQMRSKIYDQAMMEYNSKSEKEKKELEIGLWLYTLNNSKEALRNQESKIAAAQAQYQEIEQALEGFDAETERNSAEFAKLTSDIEGERQKIAAHNEEIIRISGNITLINNDIQHNLEAIERLNNEIEQLNSNDSTAQSEIDSKRKEADEKKNTAASIETKISQLEESLSNLIFDSENISRQIEEKVKELMGEELSWPWYGQLMTTPQTIAYFVQFDYWLRKFNVKFV